MVSKCISKLARSQPPRVSLNSQDYGLQVCTMTASKYISKLARSWPPSASPNSLDHCWLRDSARRPLGLSYVQDLAGLVRSLFARQPRAWYGEYFSAIFGLGVAAISLPSLGFVRKLFPQKPRVLISAFWLVLSHSVFSCWFALSDWDDFFLCIGLSSSLSVR